MSNVFIKLYEIVCRKELKARIIAEQRNLKGLTLANPKLIQKVHPVYLETDYDSSENKHLITCKTLGLLRRNCQVLTECLAEAYRQAETDQKYLRPAGGYNLLSYIKPIDSYDKREYFRQLSVVGFPNVAIAHNSTQESMKMALMVARALNNELLQWVDEAQKRSAEEEGLDLEAAITAVIKEKHESALSILSDLSCREKPEQFPAIR